MNLVNPIAIYLQPKQQCFHQNDTKLFFQCMGCMSLNMLDQPHFIKIAIPEAVLYVRVCINWFAFRFGGMDRLAIECIADFLQWIGVMGNILKRMTFVRLGRFTTNYHCSIAIIDSLIAFF